MKRSTPPTIDVDVEEAARQPKRVRRDDDEDTAPPRDDDDDNIFSMFHAPRPTFGINVATDPGIDIDEITRHAEIPADGFIRDRDTGRLADDQHGLQPFNARERALEMELRQLLEAHPDYIFLQLCAGASTRDVSDFFTLKDVLRDRVVQDALTRARNVQEKRLLESMPRRLETREAYQKRYLHLLNVAELIDTEVRGPIQQWLGTPPTSSASMLLWTRLIGGPGGDTDEFHGLLFPFYMRWQYRFLRERIFPQGPDAIVTPDDRDKVERIMAMDRILFPTLERTVGAFVAVGGDAVANYKANVLRYVLARDVYWRHRLQVHTRPGTFLTNRQWLDSLLVDVQRRAMDVVPGGRRYWRELPDNGQHRRTSPAFHRFTGVDDDERFAAFLRVLELFVPNARGDWSVLDGGNFLVDNPGDYQAALGNADDNAELRRDEFARIVDPVTIRAIADRTILQDLPFHNVAGNMAERFYAHARAPTLYEYERACDAIERMLSPQIALILGQMAQQPRWQPDHGLFVLPRIENIGGDATYYVQAADPRRPRIHAIGDVSDHIHYLRPLLEEPSPGRVYVNENALATEPDRARERREFVADVERLKAAALDVYVPDQWTQLINTRLAPAGASAFYDDVEPRRAGLELAINPWLVPNVLLPLLFGGASDELARHVTAGHYLRVGGELPFPTRVTEGGAATDTWAELLRAMRRVLPTTDPERESDKVRVYRQAAGPEAPILDVWPNGDTWQLREYASPILMLPLLWHYVRFLFDRSAERYQTAELENARQLVEQIDQEIARTQEAATAAATKHGGTSSSDIIELAQSLYVADPVTMQQPHISGHVLFTPFFKLALERLRETVQVTLKAPHITLAMLTSNEARFNNLRLAAVAFIAAEAADSSLGFPNSYQKDMQFSHVVRLRAQALFKLRLAIGSLGHMVVARPRPPRRLGFI